MYDTDVIVYAEHILLKHIIMHLYSIIFPGRC